VREDVVTGQVMSPALSEKFVAVIAAHVGCARWTTSRPELTCNAMVPTRLSHLRSTAEHRRVNRELAALFLRAGARWIMARLQEGLLPTLYLPARELWLTAHALENRYRNALGPGDPRGRLVWPSIQLNLALEPGSARPQARFLRDTYGRTWLGHSGTLGGRQTGISREGFIGFLGGDRRATAVTIGDRTERLVMLGTFARPQALLDAIVELVHAAQAYRSAIAAGLS
jgi:hypothetical protein